MEKMKEIDTSEHFKTSNISNKRGSEDEEDEEEEKTCKSTNGESSCNSSKELANENKAAAVAGYGSTRQYNRSKTPRLRWTPELHLCFLHAVARLGGQERATPKLVLQFMDIKGLNISNVKSHLQMYRNKKLDETNQEQVLLSSGAGRRGGDHQIYNFSQLSTIRNFNGRPSSTLRYGEVAAWRRHGNPIYGLADMGKNVYRDNHCLYSSVAERVFHGSQNTKSLNLDSHTASTCSFNEQDTSKAQQTFEQNELLHRFRQSQSRPNLSMESNLKTQVEERMKEEINCLNENSSSYHCNSWPMVGNKLKRKTWDSKCHLDLNLSLKIKPTIDGMLEGDEFESTSLSLSLSSSSSSKISRLKEGYESTKQERTTAESTLDLTL